MPPGAPACRTRAASRLSTTTEPPQELIRKLRIAEDLAQRLQKKDWQTRGNREKLESPIEETLELVRRGQVYARRQRIEALEKAQEELERVHDPGGRDARQRLEVSFYPLRVAGEAAGQARWAGGRQYEHGVWGALPGPC